MYLDTVLDNHATIKVISILKQEDGVAKVSYLSREQAMDEFRNWSYFNDTMNILEENSLPAVAIIIPKINFQSADTFRKMCDRVAAI